MYSFPADSVSRWSHRQKPAPLTRANSRVYEHSSYNDSRINKDDAGIIEGRLWHGLVLIPGRRYCPEYSLQEQRQRGKAEQRQSMLQEMTKAKEDSAPSR